MAAEHGHLDLMKYLIYEHPRIVNPILRLVSESGYFSNGWKFFFSPLQDSFLRLTKKGNIDVINTLLDCEFLQIERLIFVKDPQMEKIILEHPRVACFQEVPCTRFDI